LSWAECSVHAIFQAVLKIQERELKNLTIENTACSTPAREHNTNLIKNKEIDDSGYTLE
jgi:hypothetical protein